MRGLLILTGLLAPVPDLSAAEKPLDGAVIVVDAGHGGQSYSRSYTGGTRGAKSRLTESELNLRVSKELAKALTDAGATVHMTRVADHRLSREGSTNKDELHARIDYFEHFNPHFFLSVHHNAGPEAATGHTTLYKHNAADDTLYESLARHINESLAGAVPGPKRKLIKDNYHILRETAIPGTISESGFMTNPAYDTLCNQPDYPAKEAKAIARGAIDYWTRHKKDLISLRDKLSAERAKSPRDPKTFTATALNPDFQAMIAARLKAIAPEGSYASEKVGDYLAAYRKLVVTDPKVTFTVTAAFDGKVIRLAGESSERKYHDQFIDVLVAMRLYSIVNDVKIPR